MPGYSPKLDGLIRNYGDFLDDQLKDMLNPDTHAMATSLRIAFRMRTRGVPLRDKIFEETGRDVAADPAQHIAALVALAEENGSTAGQKLKAALPAFSKMMDTLEADLPQDAGLLRTVRHAKSLNLSY